MFCFLFQSLLACLRRLLDFGTRRYFLFVVLFLERIAVWLHRIMLLFLLFESLTLSLLFFAIFFFMCFYSGNDAILSRGSARAWYVCFKGNEAASPHLWPGWYLLLLLGCGGPVNCGIPTYRVIYAHRSRGPVSCFFVCVCMPKRARERDRGWKAKLEVTTIERYMVSCIVFLVATSPSSFQRLRIEYFLHEHAGPSSRTRRGMTVLMGLAFLKW